MCQEEEPKTKNVTKECYVNLQETKIGKKSKLSQEEIEIKFTLAQRKKKQLIKDKNRKKKKRNKINKK